MAPVIEIDFLSKSYGPIKGIEEVSFSVAAGNVFGFLGLVTGSVALARIQRRDVP